MKGFVSMKTQKNKHKKTLSKFIHEMLTKWCWQQVSASILEADGVGEESSHFITLQGDPD